MVFGTKYASFDNISDDSLDCLHSWVQRAFLLPTDYHFVMQSLVDPHITAN